MGKGRTVVAVVVIGLLAASTALAAGSKKVPQVGDVDGDSHASVQLVVISKGGAPKSVKNVKFNDLLSSCPNGRARISMRLFGGAAKVNGKRKFKQTYGHGGSKIVLEGKVKRDGSRVHASVEGTTVEIAGVGRCVVPKTEFTTKR